LLWLWCRPVATAPIRPLAWEPPYAAGVAQEIAKRQKDKKKKEINQQTSWCRYSLRGKKYYKLLLLQRKPNSSQHTCHNSMLIALSNWTSLVSKCMDWLSGLLRLIAVLWLWWRWIWDKCILKLSHSLRNSALRVYWRQNLKAVSIIVKCIRYPPPSTWAF